MRQAASYPAGERHHVVRIPAAVQADAGTPWTKPSSALNVTTADGEEQTEPAQTKEHFSKKKKKSGRQKAGKRARI